MWARIAMSIIGIWMMMAPALLGVSKSIADNAYVAGPLIATFSIISLWECTRNVRLLNLPVAMWLLIAPLVLKYDSDTALMHDYAVAIAIIFLLLVKPKRKYRFAGGWPAVFKATRAGHQRNIYR